MSEDMTPEEIKHEVNSISQSSLTSAAIRALLYMFVVYFVTDFFPVVSWLWYVLGAYLVFDISMVVCVKYTVYKFNRNLSDDTDYQ